MFEKKEERRGKNVRLGMKGRKGVGNGGNGRSGEERGVNEITKKS